MITGWLASNRTRLTVYPFFFKDYDKRSELSVWSKTARGNGREGVAPQALLVEGET